MSWSLKSYQLKIMEGTRNNLGIEQYCENRDAEKSKYRLGFISALIFITSSFLLIGEVFYLVCGNGSFFGGQNQSLETRWLIFLLFVFPGSFTFSTLFADKHYYFLLIFWCCIALFIVALTPLIILALKVSASMYGF